MTFELKNQLAIQDWHDNYIRGKNRTPSHIKVEVRLPVGINIGLFIQAVEYTLRESEIFQVSFSKGRCNLAAPQEFRHSFRPILYEDNENGAIYWHAIKYAFSQIRDLNNGPLCSSFIIDSKPDDYYFVFVVNHIIFDSRSISILHSRIDKCYVMLCSTGLPLASGPKYIPGAIRTFLGEPSNCHSDYWLERMNGNDWYLNYFNLYISLLSSSKYMETCLELMKRKMFHRKSFLRKSFGKAYHFVIDGQLFADFANVLNTSSSTAFAICVALFHIVLATSSGQLHAVSLSINVSKFDSSNAPFDIGNRLYYSIADVVFSAEFSLIEAITSFTRQYYTDFEYPLYSIEPLDAIGFLSRILLVVNFSSFTKNIPFDNYFGSHFDHFDSVEAECPLYVQVDQYSNALAFVVEYHSLFYTQEMVDVFISRYLELVKLLSNKPDVKISDTHKFSFGKMHVN